jgi:rubrerythrin
MPDTRTNLQEAFAGESQANRKYLAFAKKAEQDGFPMIARLFRTAAEAETIHALAHFAALDGVGSTADNLKAAFDGETHEYQKMYPPMVAQADAEKHKGKRMMDFAAKVEAVHAKLYAMAIQAVQGGKDLAADAFYLCPGCGHIESGKAPATCPVCGCKGERFLKM